MVIARLAGTIPPGKAYERTCLKKDGTTLPVLVQNRILRDESGRIIGIRSIHQDITEQKRGEEEIKKLNQFLEVIIDNADVWLDVLDEKANVLIWNKAAEAISGYSRGEVVGHSKIWEWLYPDENYRKEVINKVALAIQRGEGSEDYETTIQRKDGQTRIISWNSRSLLDERRMLTGYIALGWDITQRKKAQQEIANLQEQLRQSQKMEAVGQLAGGIAHDFNNLLTVIKGYSQLSLIQFKESDPLKVNINEINKATDRAADLIRQLLAFSRRQTMEMRVLDLNALLRNLQKMLHRVIGEDIELVTRLADDLGRVKVDPGQIEQVIMNLAVNARDAMIEGGKLTIETANVELDEEYARRHVAVTPGRYVMLAVSDTGVGITPEVRERIFEPFFTTKKGGEGTGLGLSTVYGIVKQSGGNIWVYSEPEKGTTFKIYLPLVNEPLEEKKERVVKEASPRGNETILVVEDDEVVRKLAVRILREQGHRVLEASQGVDAFLICEEHKGPIHLLVTDVVMPKMSGRELAERITSIRQEVKVLYMSGYPDDTIAHHGILNEGTNYIQKPFTVEELARKVREVLDKQVQDHYEKIG
jgi:PAS domain S-box-containing protein